MTSIEAHVLQPYKYGFVTDIESESVPPGLSEDVIRLISAKKGEPEWMLEWRLKAYRHWLTMTEPTWANVKYGPIDYQAISYYAAPKQRPKVESLDQVDPKLLETFEKLGIPIAEQKRLAGVAVDAVFDSVSVATTFRAELAKFGVIFCPISEAIREHPDLVRQYLGTVVPDQRQLLRGAQLGGVHRRLVRLHPEGRALPARALDLFPDQRVGDGSVRAHADHRRGRQPRLLSRGLLRPDARREPAARRRGGARGARRRADQVLDHPELVSGRRRRKGRDLQLRHQARRLPRPELQDLLDAGRDRLRHHLEVPGLPPPGRRLDRRVLLGGGHQPPPAGRHRDEDDPHRQEHEEHDRVEGNLRRPRAEHLPRPREDHEGRRREPAITRSATRC